MSKHIAFLSIAAAVLGGPVLGVVALPGAAVAADYYDGDPRPSVFHGRDDFGVEGERARIEHRRDLPPPARYGYRGAPGPVVFDERGPGRGDDGYGPEGGDRGPVILERPAYGYGRPAAYGPRFDRPFGDEPRYGAPDRLVPAYGPVPAYRAVSAPIYRGGDEARGDLPDVGCTIQQAQSTTAAGWHKTVTHRTCYRR